MVGKKSLFFVCLLVLIVGVGFVIATHTSAPTTFTANQNQYKLYNITISATDTPTVGNVTQINITIPTSFTPTGIANGTNTLNYTFVIVNQTAGNTLSWTVNLATNANGYLIDTANPNNYFWFNASASSIAGSYNITVMTLNATGPYRTNITVTVSDITKPLNITLLAPTPTSYNNYTNPWIYVNVTSSDNINTTTFQIYLWNATGLVDNTNFTDGRAVGYAFANYSTLPNGIYTINVTSVDSSGNINNSMTGDNTRKLVIIDSTPPVISSYSLDKNLRVYYVNQSIPLDFGATDNLLAMTLWYKNYTEAKTNISYAGTPMSINYTDTTGQFNVTLYANDSNGNLNTTVMQIIVNPLPANSIFANSTTPSITVDSSSLGIIVQYNASLQNVTVPLSLNASQAYLDVSQVQVGKTVTLANQFILTRADAAYNYSVLINASTVVTVANTTWDGRIYFPILNSSTLTAPTGSLNVAVNFGSDLDMNFSTPVKIVLGGMTGKAAAWSRGNTTLRDISTQCNSDVYPTNLDGTAVRECYRSTATDLVIWTYHFSTYAAYTLGATTTSTTSGGGGSYTPSIWTNSYSDDDKELSLKGTISRSLDAKSRTKVLINGESHYIGVLSMTTSSALMQIGSSPQNVSFNIGDTKKFDLNNDSYYDLQVTLSGIVNGKAQVTISSLHESYAGTGATGTGANGGTGTTTPSGTNALGISMTWIIVGIVVAVIIVIAILWVLVRMSKKKRGY